MNRHHWIKVLSVLAVLLVSGIPGSGQGKTWYVEKDGSGDYAVIQDAIDAAAAGDTIRIGPGRFEDYKVYSYPGGDYGMVANNTVGELVVIGSGCDVTFVGPTEWTEGDNTVGFCCINSDGDFFLSSLTVEGNYFGVYLEGGTGGGFVSDCSFFRCNYGIETFVTGYVLECNFEEIFQTGVSARAPGHDLNVEKCDFNNCYKFGFYFQGSPNMRAGNCIFRDCQVAGYFDISSGSITNCSISELKEWGVGLEFAGNGNVRITGCEISNAYRNIVIDMASNLVFESNVLNPSTVESITIFTSTPSFSNNDIHHGGGYSVLLGGFVTVSEDLHIDMANNYWGTAERDSIAAWIWDGNDKYTNWYGIKGFVDFEPFSSEPLPTQKQTLGGFRAMFR